MEINNKIKVLYVDDEPINLELFQMSFRNSYNVLVAESGPSGLDVLKKSEKIRVVVSDMKMPEMNGIEFIKKAKDIYGQICFLILTGFEINDEIRDSLNCGLIQGYFQKPLNKNEITSAINKAVL